MDPGHYGREQGWDTNSASEGYGPPHQQEFRFSGSYGGRRFLADGFPRDSGYPRNSFRNGMHERDIYLPPHAPGVWSHPRRNFDGEYALVRDSSKNVEPYHEMDSFGDPASYREADSFHDVDKFHDRYRSMERYSDEDSYHDYGYDRHGRLADRDREEVCSDYEIRHHSSHRSREGSRDRGFDHDRYNYDSDHERSKREGSWRRHGSHDRDHEKRGFGREKDQSPYRQRERSHSRGRDDQSRSRSPRSKSRRSHREDSYDDGWYERNDRRWDYDRDEKRYNDSSVAPSATVVVKGLSQKTTEEDLYQILAEWGPLRHVRVIKERNSGSSRGFAFIDFPDVDAAHKMMDGMGNSGLVIDGRKLFFEYSKPTGGNGAPLGKESMGKSSYGHGKSITAPCDWTCLICGYLNFARRTSCFQCNEARTKDAPPADIASTNPASSGKRGSDLGPTHVLVVRGLDENADEEMLRYEFAKHAPVKDLRLVRDKFTHVSRGFAFVHFHSVEDATKALAATNGTTLEKNGQVLRVAYAKSIHGPGSGAPQSSSLAAAAIEAATFAQQYDAVGWAPKEYNPDKKQSTAGLGQSNAEALEHGSAPQSGFVWDDKSGYYYDAASGFYYDGNTGLYYDGNNGVWYSFDDQTQQYVPCNEQSNNKAVGDTTNETSKTSDATTSKRVVISAPATTVKSSEKASLPDAVQAAAAAALAAEKREKEKSREIKLASKSSLLANKKKMNNVLTMWKQRNHEGQSAHVVLDDKEPMNFTDDKANNSYSAPGASTAKNKTKADSASLNSSVHPSLSASRGAVHVVTSEALNTDSQIKPRPVSSSGGTIMGVIRGSGKGIIKPDTAFPVCVTGGTSLTTATAHPTETTSTSTPFKTDASALGSYASSSSAGRGKRRFSEAPVQSVSRDQPQSTYRDRAAERRNLYGSSSATGDDSSDMGYGDSNCDYPFRKGSLSVTGAMPFPPGVGGWAAGDTSDAENYEVITSDRALDENNVGNRMLRNMGWQGLGLGKDSSGIKEPVQAKAVDGRSGLGSQQRKTDPSLEAQAGDSYRTIIQKKAMARFRDMA